MNINILSLIIFLIILLLILLIILYKSNSYTIREIPNFLSKEECEYIKQLSTNKLFQSKLFMKDGEGLDNTVRDSKQCWLNDTDDEMIQKLSQRIAKETKIDISLHEDLQVVKYDSNGFYKPHYDACDSTQQDTCIDMNKDMGPRYITFIIYLNDDFEGGETYFPNINKKIIPKMGKAVIFYNVDKKGVILNKSLHGGLNVINGEKWIANKWIHL